MSTAAALLSAALIALMAHSVASQTCATPRLSYYAITGADCVSSNFSRVVSGYCSPLECGLRCYKTPKCQAFSLNSSPCQCKLFVFNECSHRVQSVANCTNQVTVYVRSLPGVPSGRLCPSGYQYTRYGTSYKLVTTETVNWDTANQRCSQEAGLTKFADAEDMEETTYLGNLKQLTSGGSFSYWVGGHLMPGATVNSKANWYWVSCNQSMADLWYYGEPNGGMVGICAELYLNYVGGLDDWSCSDTGRRYICECQSVF